MRTLPTRTPLARRAAAVSAPLLLALSLTACGGGEDAAGAPDDASVEDFCSVLLDLDADIDVNDNGAILEAAQKNADDLAEVGTPADFSADAREGFEIYIDFVAQADEDDIESEDSMEETFGDDADKVNAYFTEGGTVCAGDLGDLGDLEAPEGELPSE